MLCFRCTPRDNLGAYIDPSHVQFIRTDGSSRAYRFLAPEVAPEYTDIVQVESTRELVQSTSASSSSRPVIKPAAKKALTQEIPVRLGPAIPKAGAIAVPQYQRSTTNATEGAEAYEFAVLEYPCAAFFAASFIPGFGGSEGKGKG